MPTKRKTTEDFVKEATIKYGNKFDYSLANYNGAHKKLNIICNTCNNIISQTADRHLQNIGDGSKICNFCRITKLNNWFYEKALIIHENRYDYSQVILNTILSKIVIKCNTCNLTFTQKPADHINNEQGCPKCKMSKGELKVAKFLNDNQIIYEQEKRFKDCRNKYPLPFDFYITDKNTCIEFDGAHHFVPHSYNSNATDFDKNQKLAITQQNDQIKTNYCINNNITLIRLNASSIIEDELKLLTN